MANSNWYCTHAHTSTGDTYRLTALGWSCPVCARVWSPTTQECLACAPRATDDTDISASVCAACGHPRGCPPQPSCPNTAHGYYTR